MDVNGAITSTVYARIGLLGNPSDGFNGKTISLSLRNFSAEVTLISAGVITFEPHPEHDLTEFSSLSDLHHRVSRHGFYGGKRLLMAACKSFYSLCQQQGIALDDSCAFRMRYRTNIPRQAGLSGSSALVVAALNCLMRFYGVEERVAFQDRPTLALAAERELGITAGLQDRVIQVYGGVVHMNFEESHMAQHGRGRYERLPCSCLPPLWLVYADCPSDSGAVHSDVRMRWERGDAAVREGMLRIASMAERGREALLAGDLRQLAECMNANFDERRQLYGDAVLGDTNLRMVAAARAVGAAAKFCGSGGAVVVLCPDGEEQALQLQETCREQGFVVVKVEVAPPDPGTETSAV